jgi:peptidoglycan/xylan/chitin deacetylase (PgdA/CDA1 family)
MIKLVVTLLVIMPSIAIANSCVVLLYHNFSQSTPKSTSISPVLFEQHLEYLKDNNFNVLSLSDMVQDLKNDSLPIRCVSLTADDAYISIYKNAYPLLKKYKMPLSVFVSTDSIDKGFKAMMSWNNMREMKNEGVEFYNHSIAHPYLIDTALKETNYQIIHAQERLKSELGVNEKMFAYPYGEENIELLDNIEKLGYIGFGQHSGAISYGNDLSNLPRFPMTDRFGDMKSFKLKVNTMSMPVIYKRTSSVVYNVLPILELEFIEPLTKSKQKQLACYVGAGKALINWSSDRTVSIKYNEHISSRRFRYNCTLPSDKKNIYYWFSKQYINDQKG